MSFHVAGALAAALSIAPEPAAPVAPSWTDKVRCAALMERLPEMMDFTVRMSDALALKDPSLKTVAADLRKAVQDSRPLMNDSNAVLREGAREAVRTAHPAWKAAATDPAARSLTADALFDREMTAARQAYAFIRFDELNEQTQANIKRFQAEMEGRCRAN